MIQTLGVIAGIVCLAGTAWLLWSLFVRFPIQDLRGARVASWGQPESIAKYAGREPSFDRSVERVEAAAASSEDWHKLLAYLDSLDRFIDPNELPSVGLRSTSHRSWGLVDDAGVPLEFNLDYLISRLGALEEHAGVDNERTKW